MMTLYVLGSGSRGNCCAVESDGKVLLIDAGFSAREIERRAEQAGLAIDRVSGIALTHEHGDHACGAARLARRGSNAAHFEQRREAGIGRADRIAGLHAGAGTNRIEHGVVVRGRNLLRCRRLVRRSDGHRRHQRV